MKRYSILMRLGIPVILLITSPILAQKTEVRVLKGAVKAETDSQTVRVDAGQKVVLADNKSPVVAAAEPLVQQLIELDKYVQEEKAAKQAAGLRVDHAGVSLGRIEADGSYSGASLYPMANHGKEPTKRLRIGPTMRQVSATYYTTAGKLIPVDIEKAGDETDYHYLNFDTPVPPGGSVNVISIGSMPASRQLLWKEGKLWYTILGDGSPFALGYRRVTLPASAILVESTLAPTEVATVNGRIMLTFRKYSGQDGSEGDYSIAFLWPERDGSSLADLPEYRGITENREDALMQEFLQGMQKILQGEVCQDQTTPVRCLLTWYSAIFRQDRDLLARCIDPDNGGAQSFAQGISANDWESMRQTATREAFVGTPVWPKSPADSYKHPVFLGQSGTRIRTETMYFAWHDGKWYRNGNAGNPWDDGTCFQKREAAAKRK